MNANRENDRAPVMSPDLGVRPGLWSRGIGILMALTAVGLVVPMAMGFADGSLWKGVSPWVVLVFCGGMGVAAGILACFAWKLFTRPTLADIRICCGVGCYLAVVMAKTRVAEALGWAGGHPTLLSSEILAAMLLYAWLARFPVSRILGRPAQWDEIFSTGIFKLAALLICLDLFQIIHEQSSFYDSSEDLGMVFGPLLELAAPVVIAMTLYWVATSALGLRKARGAS